MGAQHVARVYARDCHSWVVNVIVALDLVKCKMCGKAAVITSGMRPVCDGCRQKEQELYVSVRGVLRDHIDKKLTIQDVAEILEITEKSIMHLVDSGYFQLKMRNLELHDD
jgi:hypothetical protein